MTDILTKLAALTKDHKHLGLLNHREIALIALVREAAGEVERLRGILSVIRMKAEWRFQGSDFVSEEDPTYGKVSEAAIAATAYLREILAIANKALNPKEPAP